MPKWGVSEIVSQRDGLHEILVEMQRPRDGARNLHDFQRVRHAGAVMIPVRIQKNLRLAREPPEAF
jgi:hypothetical protein